MDTQPTRTVPAAGIHDSVPFDQYLEWGAVNSGSLKAMLRSPQHYRHYFEPDDGESKPHFALGRILHCSALEPDQLAERYVVQPPFEDIVRTADGSIPAKPKQTTAYKQAVKKFKAEHGDKEVVTQDVWMLMFSMLQSIVCNPRALEYLSGGIPEVSIVWTDPLTGILCKARVDKWKQSEATFVDLKSCADATWFPNDLAKFGHYLQLAMYADGLEVLTGERQTARVVAVESKPPFSVMAAPVGKATMDAGRFAYRTALQRLKECRESNVWPGYKSPIEFEIPDYANPLLSSDPQLTKKGDLI